MLGRAFGFLSLFAILVAAAQAQAAVKPDFRAEAKAQAQMVADYLRPIGFYARGAGISMARDAVCVGLGRAEGAAKAFNRYVSLVSFEFDSLYLSSAAKLAHDAEELACECDVVAKLAGSCKSGQDVETQARLLEALARALADRDWESGS